MQTIEAQYDIVTPMFITAADRQEEPDIRPPSIKGALRFWWRALQWGSCLRQADNPEQALHELYRQEAELFGAAYKKETRYGQGVCTLKLKHVVTKGIEGSWPISNNNSGSGFIGYGLDKTKTGDPHRKAIKEGQFTVCMMLKKGISSEQIQQLKNTLTIWGLLGGLGSRARRGFGSVAIKQLDGQSFAFDNVDQYDTAINQLLQTITFAPEMPVFTALNDAMTIKQTGQGNDARRLMDTIGNQYKTARKEAGKGLSKLPFGLPLAGNRGASDEKNRRSSPLFMHIHPIEKEFVAIMSFIPAEFHPDYPQGKELAFYKTIQNYMQSMERVYP